MNLINTGRQAIAEELAMIVTHVAQAPFAGYLAKVPNQLRQVLTGQGLQLSAKLPSLEIHWLKRSMKKINGQKERRQRNTLLICTKRLSIRMFRFSSIVIMDSHLLVSYHHRTFKEPKEQEHIYLLPTARFMVRLPLATKQAALIKSLRTAIPT